MTVLLGKYEIIRPLGSGATSEVYLARDTVLDRPIALKVLKPALLQDSTAYTRFAQEARAAAGLFHPHIATILDMGEGNGRYFIAMRYVDGPSLDQRIRQQGPLPLADVLRLTRQIGDALDFAHQNGFIHRDVKPANILCEPNKDFTLTDFGLTRALMSSGLTSHTGAILGTPSYIAPEVWLNQPIRPAVDQYSLACVIYEALTGHILFNGETPPAIMTAHVLSGPRFGEHWPASIPAEVQRVLAKALDKDPRQRFQNQQEFANALAEASQARPAAREALSDPAPTLSSIGVRKEVGIPANPPTAEPAPSSDFLQSKNDPIKPENIAAPIKNEAQQPPRQDRTRPRFFQNKLVIIGMVLFLAIVLYGGSIFLGALNSNSSPTPVVAEKNTSVPKATDGIGSPTQNLPASVGTTSPTGTGAAPTAAEKTTPTPSPTPVMPKTVLSGITPPHATETISLANAGRVVELGRWGMGGINSFAWSPDGNTLVVATTIGLYLYKASTLELLTTVAEGVWFSSAAFSSDGQFFVSGDYGGKVILWDKKGARIDTVYTQNDYIYSVAISPDHTLIAVKPGAEKILIVETATKKVKYELKSGNDGEVKFSPNGTLLAYAGWEGTSIYKVSSGGLEIVLTNETVQSGGIQKIAFLPDSKTIITGNTRGELLLWNIGDGTLGAVLKRNQNNEQFSALEVSPNGKTLLVSLTGGELELWDLVNKQKQVLPASLESVAQMMYSPKGDFLIFGSTNGLMQLLAAGNWARQAQQNSFAQFDAVYRTGVNSLFADTAGSAAFELSLGSGQVLNEFNCPGLCIKSQKGDLLASVDFQGSVSVRSTESGKVLFTFDKKIGIFGGAGSMALDPEGQYLAAGGIEGEAYVWNLQTGNLQFNTTVGNKCWIRIIAFDNDGKRLAAGTDCGLYLWNVASKQLLYHWNEGKMARSIAFSPDNRLVAAEGGVWDTVTGSLVYSLGDGIILGLSFNPKGDILAYSGYPAIVLLDAKSGKRLAGLPGHTLWTGKIFFDSTGKYLISSSDDHTVRIWGIP